MHTHRDNIDLSAAGDYTLGDHWSAIYRKRWIVILVIVVAVAFTAYMNKKLPPRYEAKVEFYVPQDVITGGTGPESGKTRVAALQQEHVDAYITVLKSNDTLALIAKRFPKKPLEELHTDVDFVVTREATVRIFVRDHDPQVAADIANGFADYFREFQRGLMETQLRTSLANVEAKIDEVMAEKRELEDAVEAFMTKHSIASLATEKVRLEEQRLRFMESRRLAEVSKRQITERIKGVEAQLASEAAAYAAGEIVLPNSLLDSLKNRLVRIEVDLAGRAADFKPDHPDMIALREQYDEAKRNLREEIDRITNSKSKLPGSLYATLRGQLMNLIVDLGATAAQIEGLTATIENVNARASELPLITLTLDRLREKIARKMQLIGSLIAVRNLNTSRLLQIKDATVVMEIARPPQSPIFPNEALNLGIAALGGLIAGIFYALFLDNLTTRKHMKRLRRVAMQEWASQLPDPSAPGKGRADEA